MSGEAERPWCRVMTSSTGKCVLVQMRQHKNGSWEIALSWRLGLEDDTAFEIAFDSSFGRTRHDAQQSLDGLSQDAVDYFVSRYTPELNALLGVEA